MVENSGGVVSRGYGLFSRILTRGFGRFFKTQVFKKKKKEPILREFNFNIYSPIIKKIEVEKQIKIPLIKRLILKYFLMSKVKKSLERAYQISNKINKNNELIYPITFKIDNRKLINTLNFLIEDD